MTHPAGESSDGALRVDFDRRLMLQFRGSIVTCDAGLLAYRELDDALGLSTMADEALADGRTGKNGRHALVGMLRQAVFGRLRSPLTFHHCDRSKETPCIHRCHSHIDCRCKSTGTCNGTARASDCSKSHSHSRVRNRKDSVPHSDHLDLQKMMNQNDGHALEINVPFLKVGRHSQSKELILSTQ